MASPYNTIHEFMSGNGQALAISTASATNSATLPKIAGVVRLVSTVDCSIEFGFNVSASAATGGFLPAFQPEYFSLSGGPLNSDTTGIKIQALSLTLPGVLYIKPCSS